MKANEPLAYPMYNGETLSWSPHLYFTAAEKAIGFPRTKAIIAAMRSNRPAELENLRQQLVKDTFGMFTNNAKELLALIEERMVQNVHP